MCLDDDCSNDGTDRRSFLVGATAAVASLTMLQTRAASAQVKQPETRVLDDPKIQHGRVVFKHNGVDSIDGYLARPKAEGVYPAVLVIAGNKISEEYIPNTCAGLAAAGFVGLAPNIYHPLPDDTPSNNAAYNMTLERFLCRQAKQFLAASLRKPKSSACQTLRDSRGLEAYIAGNAKRKLSLAESS